MLTGVRAYFPPTHALPRAPGSTSACKYPKARVTNNIASYTYPQSNLPFEISSFAVDLIKRRHKQTPLSRSLGERVGGYRVATPTHTRLCPKKSTQPPTTHNAQSGYKMCGSALAADIPAFLTRFGCNPPLNLLGMPRDGLLH